MNNNLKYVTFQLFSAFLSVLFMYYFIKQSYFVPVNVDSTVNWYNVSSILFFVFIMTESTVSLLIYFFEKLLLRSKYDWPDIVKSAVWGLRISIIFIVFVLLNIIHVVPIYIGFVIILGIILFALLLK